MKLLRGKKLFNGLARFGVHTREVIYSASLALLVKIIAAAGVFALNLVLARMLGASGSGVFFLALSIIIVISTICRVGLDSTIVRFISTCLSVGKVSKVLDIYSKSVNYTLFCTITFTIIMYFTASWLSHNVFHEPLLESQIKIMVFGIVPLSLLAIHAYVFQGLKKIVLHTSVLSVWTPLFALVIMYFFIDKASLEVAAYAYVSASFLTLIIAYISWKVVTSEIDTSNIEKVDSKELLKVSIPVLWIVILNLIITWSPILLLGAWSNSESIGVYSAASRLALLTSFILIAVNSIAAPKFAALYHTRDIEGLQAVYRSSLLLMIFAASPILLAFLIVPEWFMGLFGEEFLVGKNALIILAVGQFVNVMTGSVGQILLMCGYEYILKRIAILCAILSVSLGFALIPSYGLLGAAFSTVVVMIVQNLLATLAVKRMLGINVVPWKRGNYEAD